MPAERQVSLEGYGKTWKGIPPTIKAASYDEARKNKAWAESIKNDAEWNAKASDMSRRMRDDYLTKSLDQLALDHAWYWKMRAETNYDMEARRKWNMAVEGSPMAGGAKPIKETEEGYYYKFPDDGRYYIIRWLKDGGFHLYPHSDGMLPEGDASRAEAEEHVKRLGIEAKVVDAKEVSKYPVPKRF